MAWEEARGQRTPRIYDPALWLLASLVKQLEYVALQDVQAAIEDAKGVKAMAKWGDAYEARQW